MKITELLLGIVVFSMVTLGFVGMYTDIADTYGRGDIEELTFMRGTVTSINSTLANMEQQFEEEVPVASQYWPLIAPFTALNFLWGTMDMGRNMITDVISINETSGGIPVPDWFGAGVITIFMIVIVMGVIAAFLKYKP